MKKILLMICLLASACANGQIWGLYTLYSVKGTSTVYLVDTNGTPFKTWTFPSNKKTCFSTYLIPGDTLVRTVVHPGNSITGGPVSGEVQKVDWNGNVVWDFVYSSSSYVLHHDICPLPNGNVLMISYEVKSAVDAVQAGSSVNGGRFSEKIIEVHQTGPTTGTIVWEWKIWDHLCQDYDISKSNYVTSILHNPQLIDINYDTLKDMFHFNGIDYNASLDQIAVSALAYNEIYVIDHSTNTTTAAGHTGGNSGHGGDIIYRWGNPPAYGAAGTKNFRMVHDAHWVPQNNSIYPNYLCGFNNNGGAGQKSCVDIFSPPYNGYNYSLTLGSAYLPLTYSYRYTSVSQTQNEGSSQQLPNGNSLVCLTFCDTIIEVNNSGTILWAMNTNGSVSMAFRYSKCYVRGPVVNAGASLTQINSGTPVTLNSSATSVTETSSAYTYSWSSIPSGLSSSIQNPIIYPTSTAIYIVTVTNTLLGCSDTASVTVHVGTTEIKEQISISEEPEVYPNPFSDNTTIAFYTHKSLKVKLTIYNCMGEEVKTILNDNLPAGNHTIEVNANDIRSSGVYFFILQSDKKTVIKSFVVKK
jgi:hypothetical protein